jgi:hypothetical protein
MRASQSRESHAGERRGSALGAGHAVARTLLVRPANLEARVKSRHWAPCLAATLAACGGAEPPTSVPETPSAPSAPAVVVTSARWEAPLPIADAGERPLGRCSPFTQTLCRLFYERTAPAVAANGDGQAVALWQRWEGDGFRLVASRFAPGGGWTEGERVTPETAVSSQRVAVDGRGNAVALWFDDALRSVRSSYGSAAGGWSVAQDLAAGDPQLVMEEGGTAHLLYTRHLEGLLSSRLPPGGSWSAPVALQAQGPTSQPFVTDPLLSVTRGGALHAVWVRRFQSSARDEEWDEVWSSRMPRGQAWAAPSLVARFPRANVLSPALAATDRGALASYQLVERTSGSFDRRRVVAQQDTGGRGVWTTPEPVSEPVPDPPRVRNASLPVAAADAGTSLTLVWAEDEYGPSEGDRYEIRARRFSAVTGAWDHAQRIASVRGYLYDRFPPQVAASAAGDAVALWVEQDSFGFGLRLWASVFVPGAGWSVPEALRDAERLSSPALTMDGSGNALVLWSEPEGDRTRIWSARLAAVTAPAR